MEKYFNKYEHKCYTVIEILIEKLDLFNTPDVLNQFEKIPENLKYPDVILDLKNVKQIDSVGIGFLIAIKHNCLKKGNDILLVSNNEVIQRVFDITKMGNFLRIFQNLEEAVKYIENNKAEKIDL